MELYIQNINKMVHFLSEKENVKSIHQLGSIGDPGISDIDILVIFKKGGGISEDPRNILDRTGRYLFTHQLFGLHEDLLDDAMEYSLFHNFKLLYGNQNIIFDNNRISKEVKVQIAIEYLLKMFISLNIQKHSRIIKLRSFLLEAKAVAFDLEVLDLLESPLGKIIKKILLIRKEWFDNPLLDRKVVELFLKFLDELEQTIKIIIETESLVVPKIKEYQLSRSITLSNGSFKFNNSYKLSDLSSIIPTKLLKKYFGFINRISLTKVSFPIKEDYAGSALFKKSLYEKKAVQMNKIYAPKFISLKSPLKLIQ